jgi:hypothetical protein
VCQGINVVGVWAQVKRWAKTVSVQETLMTRMTWSLQRASPLNDLVMVK